MPALLGLVFSKFGMYALAGVIFLAYSGWLVREGKRICRAEVRAELAEVNDKLREFTLKDETNAAKDEARRARDVVDAINTLAATGQCKLTRAQAEALGRIN